MAVRGDGIDLPRSEQLDERRLKLHWRLKRHTSLESDKHTRPPHHSKEPPNHEFNTHKYSVLRAVDAGSHLLLFGYDTESQLQRLLVPRQPRGGV